MGVWDLGIRASVIPVEGFSILSHRYGHPTPWRSRVGNPDGSPGKISPGGEKHYLEAVWRDL